LPAERFARAAEQREKPLAALSTGRRTAAGVDQSFVQAAFFFDDFTQASTKATPSTPSCTVG
jgi:hypothetical protein